MEIYLVVVPGTGGQETIDCSNIILEMYKKFFQKKGINISEMLDYPQLTDKTSYEISGNLTDNLTKFLLSETGIHRFVRISPFDEKKRRHTSFVKVYFSEEYIMVDSVKSMNDLEQKRSYIHHPYIVVRDHKTNEETENLQEVLSGNLDIFMTKEN